MSVRLSICLSSCLSVCLDVCLGTFEMTCDTSRQGFFIFLLLLRYWLHSEWARQGIVYKSVFLSRSIFKTMALVWNMASVPSESVKRSLLFIFCLTLSSWSSSVPSYPSPLPLAHPLPHSEKVGRSLSRHFQQTELTTRLSSAAGNTVGSAGQIRWSYVLE